MADSAVREHLLTLSNVTALVVNRIYTTMLPQSPTLPAIQLTFVDERQLIHLRGAGGPFEARVQVDVYAKSDAVAKEVFARVHGDGAGSGLSGWRGSVGSPPFVITGILPDISRHRGFIPPELGQFRVSIDFMVHHKGGYV